MDACHVWHIGRYRQSDVWYLLHHEQVDRLCNALQLSDNWTEVSDSNMLHRFLTLSQEERKNILVEI